jgi:hypothetical protein
MEHEIGIWFLLLSLFVPRFVLFFWWMTGNLPFNTTPFLADVICSFFLPRVLILVFIYQSQGMSPWFYIHLVAMVIAWGYNILHMQENMEKLQKMAS